MREDPLVSVIIPLFNGAKYVGAAIESVLAQSHRPLQIVVVDDGSTDNGAGIARSFDEVDYSFQDHAGLAAALNTGVSMAKGELVAFLDSDDLWMPGKLDKQMAALDADPGLSMVFGDVEQFHESGPDGEPSTLGVFRGCCKSAMLTRRSALQQVGAFDVSFPLGDFLDWYARAEDLGLKSLMLPNIVARRRVHDTNMGIRFRDRTTAYAHVLKRALDRRRETAASNPC